MSALSVQPLYDTKAPILVIDDQPLMVDLITRIIRHLGFENVDHSKDGMTALLMMARKKYRLVISDWQMEPLDGLTLLRTVRADRLLARTKFLIMTARMNSDDVVEAKSAGVDNFILKPFTPEALQAKIAEIL
jgi:two-component system, chemotaxis family, chemotaxis protein CheY